MQLSEVNDASSVATDTKIVLRVDVLDALMARRGAPRPSEQAERFGLNRTHYFDLRAGRNNASLAVALRIAAEAGTTVEVLFGRAA